MSSPLFTLCPEEGDFQARILHNSSSGMVLFYKTVKKKESNHQESLDPSSLSQPAGIQPEGQQKGT